MSEDKNHPETGQSRIEIDYDAIDVASIMAQIKKNIAARPRPLFEDAPPSPLGPQAPPPDFDAGGEIPGSKSRARKLLLKVMRPFAPIIKLLILPVHEELRQTVVTLDRTNRRLDYLFSLVEREMTRIREDLNGRIDVVNERSLAVHYDVAMLKEYSKLLHALSHNLVVELTKLRIEHETLRGRARIMEKDFEFLGRRERALEKELLK